MTTTSPYDELPYADVPVPQSQPELLAAIAQLRGMTTQDVRRASVLELGCGQGRNVIALAERHATSTFVGIDSSERQIAAARETANILGLSNIEFRQASILDVGHDLGTFDYIIAHAVYSWVEAPVRDKLLEICSQNLAPHGVAFVSYNTYPGWQLHEMFRHMMVFEARNTAGSVPKIAKGWRLLEFLKGSLPGEASPYNALVHTELQRLMQPEAWYLRHDHMAEVNCPVYFQQFIDHARQHKLQFLADCAVGLRFHDELESRIEQNLARLTPDPVQQEQYRDILRNRPFRQTLLCHEGIELVRSATHQQLAGLYFEAQLRPEDASVSLATAGQKGFLTTDGLRITASKPLIKAALAHLGQIWPREISLDELVAAACAEVEAHAGSSAPPPEPEVLRLKESLLESCLGRIVGAYSQAHQFTTTVSDRPAASPLARWQAKQRDAVTNRKHQSLRLDTFELNLLPLVDGSRDLAQLVTDLTQHAVEGRFFTSEAGQHVQDPERIREIIQFTVPQSLRRLAENALLVN